jgi:DNA-binding NarL/FixJ family response regulator
VQLSFSVKAVRGRAASTSSGGRENTVVARNSGEAVMSFVKGVDTPGGSKADAETRADFACLTEAAHVIYAVLSPSERAVLLAAARGAEDKEIAHELGCTLSTVRTLWQRTYKKTHIASRRRLIATIWGHAVALASRHFLNDVT